MAKNNPPFSDFFGVLLLKVVFTGDKMQLSPITLLLDCARKIKFSGPLKIGAKIMLSAFTVHLFYNTSYLRSILLYQNILDTKKSGYYRFKDWIFSFKSKRWLAYTEGWKKVVVFLFIVVTNHVTISSIVNVECVKLNLLLKN